MSTLKPNTHLFNLSDLTNATCKEFSFIDEQGESINAFAIKSAGNILAYVNSCPHTGAELNWQPDNFLNFDDSFIMCFIHGALFNINDGLCVQGPCLMQNLKQLDISIENDSVYLETFSN